MIVIYFDKIHGLIRINESTTLFPDQPSILQHKPSINFSDQLLKEKKKKKQIDRLLLLSFSGYL